MKLCQRAESHLWIFNPIGSSSSREIRWTISISKAKHFVKMQKELSRRARHQVWKTFSSWQLCICAKKRFSTTYGWKLESTCSRFLSSHWLEVRIDAANFRGQKDHSLFCYRLHTLPADILRTLRQSLQRLFRETRLVLDSAVIIAVFVFHKFHAMLRWSPKVP